MLRTAGFLAIIVFAGTLGEICVTRAMKRVGEVSRFTPGPVLRALGRGFRIGWIWLGIALMALSFYCFLALLSWEPMSFVIPATALSYVTGALGAKFLLDERVSVTRWAGVSLVCVGVVLASLGAQPDQRNLALVLTAMRGLVLALALAPMLYYLLAMYSALRYVRGKRRLAPPSDFAPPVSVLKPVRGLDEGAYENFASFCRQDYPEYEILFAVSDANDPVIPVIERLIRDFPERPIRLLIGAQELGASSKVNKLCRLVREARYSLLVASDSDVRVEPNYLRGVVAHFRDPQVGAVTSLFRGIVVRQFASELDGVGSSAEFCAGALTALQLEGGLKFTLGATMATTKERLAEIGGFEALVDHHSDDFELGHRIAARGYRVELNPEPVWMVFPAETLATYLRHELRWAIGLRHIRPWAHFGLLLSHGLPWSVAAALLAPSGGLAVGYLGAYVLLRFLMAWIVGVWALRDDVVRRRFWLLPVRDVFAFVIWLWSFGSNRIQWRGLEFMIREGRLVPVAQSRSAARS